MSLRFGFSTAGRIEFGPGEFARIGRIALTLGRRPLLVAGLRRAHLAVLVAELTAGKAVVTELSVTGEPDTETVAQGLALARGADCDCVIAVGGGSVLDTGKAIAALQRQPGGLFDYLEVIGRGEPLSAPGVPLVAVPTTAGTGAEATCNAVIASAAHRVKVSLRHPSMFPVAAVVDPELTLSLPPGETAASGLDALTQLIEPFVSTAAGPLTDALCREGLARTGRSLRRVFAKGDDLEARTDLSLAALFSGLALANARLGAVHGLAGPLGGMTGAPHGRLCAALLPTVMEMNIRLLAEGRGDPDALGKYDEAARLLTGSTRARARDGVSWVRETCQAFGIGRLSALGFAPGETGALVEKALQASSMKGNPVPLTASEIMEIISRSF
jgi:alcohol dehydrogenase class IV